jgi:hypothetical protein
MQILSEPGLSSSLDGVTPALPHLVGVEGALATIPLPLDAAEQAALSRSSEFLREAIELLNLN